MSYPETISGSARAMGLPSDWSPAGIYDALADHAVAQDDWVAVEKWCRAVVRAEDAQKVHRRLRMGAVEFAVLEGR